MVIEGRMLGNRPLRRPRSRMLDNLILEDGIYDKMQYKERSYEESDTRPATAYGIDGRAPEREHGISTFPNKTTARQGSFKSYF